MHIACWSIALFEISSFKAKKFQNWILKYMFHHTHWVKQFVPFFLKFQQKTPLH